MTHTPTHSPKTIATLQAMGCDTTGWALPPVEWRIERRPVPTKQRCPTCHGRGQVAAPTADTTPSRHSRMVACPTCPRRRQWPDRGSGEVTVSVERDVEVGYLLWPDGTRFDSPRRGGSQCDLCGKRIQYDVPVLGTDAQGVPHGMWVGEDCAKTLLGVALAGTPIAAASEAAAARAARERNDRQAAALWREVAVPKPPKVVKPTLACTLDPEAIERVLLDAFGEAALHAPRHPKARRGGATLEVTRAQARYVVMLENARGKRAHLEILQTLTGGLTIRESFGSGKPFAKDKTASDATALLITALPKIAAAFGFPGDAPARE